MPQSRRSSDSDSTGDERKGDQQDLSVDPSLTDPYPMTEIRKPGDHDVLCGRGGGTNNHSGNVKFRKLVNEHKMRYLAAPKVDKPKVAREVVKIWRAMDPPGRFLARMGGGTTKEEEKNNENVMWYDVGDKKAREKASQCLRERTPEVMPFVKKLKDKEEAAAAAANSRKYLEAQMAAAAAVAGHPANLQRNQSDNPNMIDPAAFFQDAYDDDELAAHIAVQQQRLRPLNNGSRNSSLPSSLPIGMGNFASSFEMQAALEKAAALPESFLAGQFIVASNGGNSGRHDDMPPPMAVTDGYGFPRLSKEDMMRASNNTFAPFNNFDDVAPFQHGRLPCDTVFEGNEEDAEYIAARYDQLALQEYQRSLANYMDKAAALAMANSVEGCMSEIHSGVDIKSEDGVGPHILNEMRENSWIRSFHSIDTFSMTDTSLATPKQKDIIDDDDPACRNDMPDPISMVTIPNNHHMNNFMNSQMNNHMNNHMNMNQQQGFHNISPQALHQFYQQQQLRQAQIAAANAAYNSFPSVITSSAQHDNFSFRSASSAHRGGVMPLKANGLSRSQKMNNAKQGSQTNSNLSMFSEVTDFSLNSTIRSNKMNASRSMKSENSMMSELTDLSETISLMSLNGGGGGIGGLHGIGSDM